jgi:hypothetical protein
MVAGKTEPSLSAQSVGRLEVKRVTQFPEKV